VDLSVIIVNYNVRAFLESALVSVRKAMNGISGEIIVVDNASDDGSVEMMQQKFPDVQLIANRKNLGFAAANNQAMRQSRGTYLLLLNPDTLVQEDTFRVMIDFLEHHPGVGMAGCKILNPDGTLQLACRRSFPTPWVAFTKVSGLSSLFPHSQLFGKYNLAYLSPDQSYEVDAISGSFMFLRKSVFDTVGGLDEQFFMYGEDLDWCYRIKNSGSKIYYVHSTQIIHYKGESARRSDIDEVKLFYQAMRVFVQKHLRRGIISDAILRVGIAIREWIAFLGKIAKPLRAALLDGLLVNCSLLLGELMWFRTLLNYPDYALPVIFTVPALAIVASLYWLGAYTTRKLSSSRTMGAVIVGYIFISALTFFFKQYGFSRMIVVISGIISVFLLPGWRLMVRAVFRSPGTRTGSLFGRRTLIVGTEQSGQEVLRKLRARVSDGYDVIGFIDNTRKRVGEKVSGVEILGSIDNIGKVIQEQKASEVIFSTDMLSYTDILAVISKTGNRAVNFRLVPSGLEVIIGKTHIDELDDIPLVDIEYNINRPLNRFLKRLVDLTGSTVLLLTLYPLIVIQRNSGNSVSRFGQRVLLLPQVFAGEMSLVGPAETMSPSQRNGSVSSLYWGKPGLTGLVHLNFRDDLTSEEIERYNVYYAKNQSLMLDIEILLKSFILFMKQ
jgi:GT2 family glycosyltransferase